RTPSNIPQVFIPYKEVLDVYDAGLDVPDHVTLVWCDDNYGYIRRLSNEKEQLHSGGSGIYYHVSYWGRPHDYLWLASTSPALVYTEMKRAYEHGADKLWILNVGDIKPAEYLMEFFLDLAWDIHLCEKEGSEQSVFNHLNHWTEREFGTQKAQEITSILKSYYHLANFRKPEHTGWSKVEEPGYPKGLTPVIDSEYNPVFNNEVERRIQQYASIEERVKQVKQYISDTKKNSYFQLVEYPVRGASLMNKKWLYAQLAHYYTDRDLERAKIYAAKSLQAYSEIERITREYAGMENGKWNRIIDFKPRKLPVFDMPVFSKLDSLIRINDQPVRRQEPVDNHGIVLAQNAIQAVKLTSNEKVVEGLGHSFSAIQMKQYHSLTFIFDIPKAGEGKIKVATIPNHDVDGNGMKISLSIEGNELMPLDYSVKGRSEIWKQNVLRGQAITTFKCDFLKTGATTITVKALTPYIIIDQIMIEMDADEHFYEFPVTMQTGN
ncbi:hypothetical protein EZS27_015203, partial [termite gut metagenome]